MKRNKKQSRKSVKNIKQAKKAYDSGLKIFSPRGKLIYTGKPGFVIDYGELLRKDKLKYRGYGGY